MKKTSLPKKESPLDEEIRKQLEGLIKDMKDATQEENELKQQKRAASYKNLSSYSKTLHEKKIEAAVSKLIDAVEKLTDLVIEKKITHEQAEKCIKQIKSKG